MGRKDSGLALSDAQEQFLEATTGLGAYSPETARPRAELPQIPASAIDQLLAADLIREGAPGTYYVWERRLRLRAIMDAPILRAAAMPAEPFSWRRFTSTTVLFLLMALVSVIAVKLAK